MILCIMDTVDIWKHKSKNVKHKKIICNRAYYLFMKCANYNRNGCIQ